MSSAKYLIDTSAAVRILTGKQVRAQWNDHLAEGVVARLRRSIR